MESHGVHTQHYWARNVHTTHILIIEHVKHTAHSAIVDMFAWVLDSDRGATAWDVAVGALVLLKLRADLCISECTPEARAPAHDTRRRGFACDRAAEDANGTQ